MTGITNFGFSEVRHHICAQRWGSMVATVYDSNRGSLENFDSTCVGHYPESHGGLDRSSLHVVALQTKNRYVVETGRN